MPLLEVADIHTYYGAIQALRGVSLTVEEGEVVTIIGSNGAGKSTTLRSIAGLTPAALGTVTFDGRDITRVPAHEIVDRGIALSPEGRHCFARMSVRENLDMGAYRRRDSGIGEDLDRIFDLFPRLKERETQKAGTLSGGEQQMLAIGRALMTNPRLTILDEATEGLAPLIREEIWNCLTALKAEGESILVIDKNVDALVRIADRHIVLEKGRVVWRGSSAELRSDSAVKDRFLHF